MKIYKISSYSECGSWFGAYLKEVTILANSEEEAIEKVKQWCREKREEFINPESDWTIQEINPDKFGVMDYNIDSDY